MTIWRGTLYNIATGLYHVGKEQLICKLKKSFYGLKQALRQCYLKFDRFVISSGFTKLQADHYCYSKWFENFYIILLLYIDDMLDAGSSMKEILNLKAKLVEEFSMKGLEFGEENS